MALESVSLKGDDESFMADDLEDGEILDEEDEAVGTLNSASVAEDEKKAKDFDGNNDRSLFSPNTPGCGDREKLQNDESSMHHVGTGDKGIRRDSNEGVDNHLLSDDDARRKRKKKKKRHRESDDEERPSKESKRQKRSHHRKRDEENGEHALAKQVRGDGEEEDDDDEMMFVRGASPSHLSRLTSANSSHSHRRERKQNRDRPRSSPLLQTPPEYTANFGDASPLHSSRSVHHSNAHRHSRSPHSRPFRRNSRSPTSTGHEGGQYDDQYESYDSDYEREGTHFRRGVGRSEEVGARRGMEDRLGARKRRGRGGVVSDVSSRGSSRGLGPGKRMRKEKRGGGRGEATKSRRPERSGSICMFYMQGKCQKGEECSYSHDATPPRKLELCKFYLMDCCAKKDKCLYMHKDFPCKYFHTGMKCFSGDKCKFSHGPLNECLKAILLKHLETAPKEILGDFPRLTREGAAAMVLQQSGEMEAKLQAGESAGQGRKGGGGGSNGHKIPSLFEIDIPMPDDVEVKDERSRRPTRGEGEEEDNNGGDKRHGFKGNNAEEEKTRHSRRDEEERKGGNRERRMREVVELREEEEELDEPEEEEEEEGREEMGGDDGGKLSIVCEEEEEEEDEEEKNEDEMVGESEKDSSHDRNLEEESLNEDDASKKDASESGTDVNDPVVIPLHLPKKQRELFMRIQQQQREAESSRSASGENEEDEDDVAKEENWYSSDEEAEDRSLTDVLKNLSKQPTVRVEAKSEPSHQVVPSAEKVESPSTLSSSGSKFSLSGKVLEALSLGDLSKISITPDISKLLSAIRENATAAGSQSPPVTPQSSDSDSRSTVRDPRRVGPRDPRQRTSVAAEPPRDPRTKPVMLSPRAAHPSPQIPYSNSPLLSDHGDVDLRQLPEGDVDLRRAVPVVSAKRDTDLRGRQFGDTDLRRMPPGGELASLPFRPVAPPEPATEIDASINSHPPIPFRLIPVSPRDSSSSRDSLYVQLPRGLLPTPDSIGQVQNDPRMRKVLRLDESQDESLPTSTTPAAAAATPVGSPVAATPPTPSAPRVDPRRARPNNPPSPPKPVPAPTQKDPRNHQAMTEMSAAPAFTPDPRLATRAAVANDVNKSIPIIPSNPHPVFHPNMAPANMMGGQPVMDNMGMMPMSVMGGADMVSPPPPQMGMGIGNEDMVMNRGVSVRGALLMDPVPEYPEEYPEEDDGGMMMPYQDGGGYGGMNMGGMCNPMMEQHKMPRRGFFRGGRRGGRGRGWDGGHRGGHRGGRGEGRGSWRGDKGRSGRRGHALPL